MTRQHSFKRLVRGRMARTGESYTAARHQLLAGASIADHHETPLATTDERIRERSGLGWEEWFDLLDGIGGQGMSHREMARWVAGRQGIAPLAWVAQAVTTSYERARGLRDVGERPDGFAVSVSRTMPVAVEQLYAAVTDDGLRAAWLEGDQLRARKVTPYASAHYDWDGDGSRVHIHVEAKGEDRSVISVEHARLADATARARAQTAWRDRLAALRATLQGGGLDG